MKRLATLLCLLATPAMAADYVTSNVLASAPVEVTASLGSRTGYRSILIENGGSNAIYCSRNPSVTTNTGHKVGANDGWRAFPWDGPIYCIAAVADQTGTNRDLTIVWGSPQ
jgi:hypothetical protein